MEHIRVFVRVRPLSKNETASGEHDSNGPLVALSVEYATETKKQIRISQTPTKPVKLFAFDDVFDMDTTQEQVFDEIVPLLDRAFDGYNATIFTYGQTGTGKTHTMLGHDLWELAFECPNENPLDMDIKDEISKDERRNGIIPRCMKYFFESLQDSVRWKGECQGFKIHVSYLEIYNEKIIDLLLPDNEQNMNLDIREDKNREIFVAGLTEVEVISEEDVLRVLWRGAQKRAMTATDMNEHSSRSHTIFTVTINRYIQANREPSTMTIKKSKVNLVDLAGSEKWKSHQLNSFSEQRIKELKSINQSLSNLGNCISALFEAGRTHIPFRNSKLTRLLQDSLGGNTKTAFIATINPSSSCLEETISTLQFADRAMQVQVYATPNEELDDANLIKRYEHEIQRLRAMLKSCMSTAKIKLRSTASNMNCLEGNFDSQNPSSPEELEETEMTLLKNKNFHLLEELDRTRGDLLRERKERQQILQAIFGAENVEIMDCDMDLKTLEAKFKEQIGLNQEEEYDYNDISARAEKDPSIQLKVLQIQQVALQNRRKELEANEQTQEEMWIWLEQYHDLITTLPKVPQNISDGGFPSEQNEGSNDTVSLLQRLSLMESSVRMQYKELQRAKSLFLKEQISMQAIIENQQQDICSLRESDALQTAVQKNKINRLEEAPRILTKANSFCNKSKINKPINADEPSDLQVEDIAVEMDESTISRKLLETIDKIEKTEALHYKRYPNLSNSKSDNTPKLKCQYFNKTKRSVINEENRHSNPCNDIVKSKSTYTSRLGENLVEKFIEDEIMLHTKSEWGLVPRKAKPGTECKIGSSLKKSGNNSYETIQISNKPIWLKHRDPRTGYDYYHNRLTGVTQWEKPNKYETYK